MKKTILFLAAIGGTVALAQPEVTNVQLSRGAMNDPIVITYALSEPAVVLVDILTNGVSVGSDALTAMKGDAGHLVAAGNRKATWLARKAGLPKNVEDGSVKVTAKVQAWSRYSPPDYLVVDLTQPSNFTYYATAEAIPGGIQADVNKTDRMIFRKIPAAGETMILGSGKNEVPSYAHAATNDYVNPESSYIKACDQLSHPVGFTNDYYLAIYECTQGQWLQLSSEWTKLYKKTENPPWGPTHCSCTNCPDSARRPVTGRRYSSLRGMLTTSVVPCNWPIDGHSVSDGSELKRFRDRTGLLFDLPTVAQWEFAARAGVTTITPSGNAFLTLANVTAYAWCADNWRDDPMSVACGNENQIHAVGQKLPNAWGLYDMLGNSSECCLDIMDSSPKEHLDPLKGAYSIDYPGPTAATGDSELRRARVGGRYSEPYDRMRFSRRAGMAATLGSDDATFRAWLPAESPAWQLEK